MPKRRITTISIGRYWLSNAMEAEAMKSNPRALATDAIKLGILMVMATALAAALALTSGAAAGAGYYHGYGSYTHRGYGSYSHDGYGYIPATIHQSHTSGKNSDDRD